MSLNTVATNNTILAADINQLVDVLQRGAGHSETGKYILQGWASANGDFISMYITSLSRTSVPVSVIIDQADLTTSNLGSISTGFLTANGFQIFSTANNGAQTNCHAGGNTTINY